MNCIDAREHLGAFLDGELEAALAVQVEAHLAECEACRAELESLRELTGMLHALPRHSAPAAVAREVAAALERNALLAGAGRARPRRRWWMIASSGAAAALLMAAVGIYVVFHNPPAARTGAPAMTDSGAVRGVEAGARYAGSTGDHYAKSGDNAAAGGALAMDDSARYNYREPWAMGVRGKEGGGAANTPTKPGVDADAKQRDDLGVPVAMKPSAPETPAPATTLETTPTKAPGDRPNGPVNVKGGEIAPDAVAEAERPEVFELDIAASDLNVARARINTVAASLNIRAVQAQGQNGWGNNETQAPAGQKEQQRQSNTRTQELITRFETQANAEKLKKRVSVEDSRLRTAMNKVAQNSENDEDYEVAVGRLLGLLDQAATPDATAPVILAVPEDKLDELVTKLSAAAVEGVAGQKGAALKPVAPEGVKSELKKDLAEAKPADPLDEFLAELDKAAKEDAERERMSRETAGRAGEGGLTGRTRAGDQRHGQTQTKPAAQPSPTQQVKDEETTQQAGPMSQQQARARRLVYVQINLTRQAPPEAAKPTAPATK